MILVKELMSENVLTLKSTDTLTQARKLMTKHRIRHVPVVDDGKVVGIISQRDVLAVEESPVMAALPEQRIKREQEIIISDFYHQNVASVESQASALSAARYMQKHKFGCLPVIDNDQLVGIVTDSDFINVAVNLLEINELHANEG